jgi:hypothetical protein
LLYLILIYVFFRYSPKQETIKYRNLFTIILNRKNINTENLKKVQDQKIYENIILLTNIMGKSEPSDTSEMFTNFVYEVYDILMILEKEYDLNLNTSNFRKLISPQIEELDMNFNVNPSIPIHRFEKIFLPKDPNVKLNKMEINILKDVWRRFNVKKSNDSRRFISSN